MQSWIAGLLIGLLGWSVQAQEHPACQDLAIAGINHSTEELLSIAASCQVAEISELYFNRAQYRRLLQKFVRFERSLQHYGERDNMAYVESYRIHIGMAEAFASARLRQQDETVVRRLNRIYEESSEIAEMRFRGYDLLADRLEQKIRL